jgi:hypothetical protein
MRVQFPGLLAAVVSSLLLSGCFNMPTPTSEITASPSSRLDYGEYTCPRLSDELGSLVRREMQLAEAQGQRIKSSNVLALLIGFGQGDGSEAEELAKVRGEKEAVLKAMYAKQCGT